MKHTPRSPKGKSPEMSTLDLDDDPFQRLHGKLDRTAKRYAAMEAVIKEASIILGDCKTGSIVKELMKLKEKDAEALEAANRKLQLQVNDLKVELALKEEEIQKYKTLKIEAILEIREIVGHPSDILNKARLFTKYLNKNIAPTLPKVIAILHGYHQKMEAVLGEVRKLVSGTVGESSQPLLPAQTETPLKEKLLDELKTPPAQRPGKEPSAGVSGGVSMTELSPPPPPEVPTPTLPEVSTPTPLVVPVPEPRVTPKAKVILKTPTTKSPTPSPRKLSLRKPQILTPAVQELGDTTEETASSGDTEDDEEVSSPRKGRGTRSAGKRMPKRSPPALKRPTKTFEKGEPSNKKPRAN